MPYLAPYHLAEQHAAALIGPLAATVADLESRAAHFAARLELSDADRASVLAAQRVLADARAALARIQSGG
ncbi:MAG: hypothetical protein U0821_11230 [Chloroflexota bacterium]